MIERPTGYRFQDKKIPLIQRCFLCVLYIIQFIYGYFHRLRESIHLRQKNALRRQ